MKLPMHAIGDLQPDEQIWRWLDTTVPRNILLNNKHDEQENSHVVEHHNDPGVDTSCLHALSKTRVRNESRGEESGRTRFRREISSNVPKGGEHHPADLRTSECQSPARHRINSPSQLYRSDFPPPPVKRPKARKVEPGLGSRMSIRHNHEQASSSQKHEAETESPSKKYARRKRHKTKTDKYEFKGHTQVNITSRSHGKNHAEIRSKRKNSAAMLNESFEAPNVESERLILDRPSGRGLFCKGKSSAVSEHRDLPDLTFSAMNFLLDSQKDKGSTQDLTKNSVSKREDRKRKAHEITNFFSGYNDDEHDRTRQKGSQHSHGDSDGLMPTPDVRGEKPMNPLADGREEHRPRFCVLHRHGDGKVHFSCLGDQTAPQTRDTDSITTNIYTMPAPLVIPSNRAAPDLRTAILQCISEHDQNRIEGSRPCKTTPSILSLENYARRALISDQPGIWRGSRDVKEPTSIPSITDLRNLAEKISSESVTIPKLYVNQKDQSWHPQRISDSGDWFAKQLYAAEYDHSQFHDLLSLIPDIYQKRILDTRSSIVCDQETPARDIDQELEFEDVVKSVLELGSQQDKVPDSSSLEALAQSDIDVLKHQRSDMQHHRPISGLNYSLKQDILQSYLPPLQAYFGGSLSTPCRSTGIEDQPHHASEDDINDDGYSRRNTKDEPECAILSIDVLNKTIRVAGSKIRRLHTISPNSTKELSTEKHRFHSSLYGDTSSCFAASQNPEAVSWADYDPHEPHQLYPSNTSGEREPQDSSDFAQDINSEPLFLGFSRPYLLY